ncbi:MAG: tRNA (guanosine(46)-N7)-methyltransferase TrmB, partial [Alphaproteobacteria bacterium]
HAGRRFVSPATLDELARLVRDGGEVRIATDDVTYLRWTLEHATAHPCFRWTARCQADWRAPPADWVPTRYEAKAVREGRPPFYLCFERRPRAENP